MRLTNPLCRARLGWKIKNLWKNHGVMREPVPLGHWALKQTGVEMEDFRFGRPKPPLERWEPPVKDDPRWWKRPTAEELPNWNEQPAFSIYQATRLLLGLDQASLLSKSRVLRGLPEGVERLVGAVCLPDQEKLVQQSVMLSQAWNPTMDKLPRRFDKEKIGYNFNREYGVPDLKAQDIMIRNLLLKCQSLAGRFPSLLHNRRIIKRPYMGSHYYFRGDQLINIQGFLNYMVSGDRPVPAFAGEDEVDGSVREKLPDIWPVSPTNSVLSTHNYTIQSNTGFREAVPHSHPHLVFLASSWRNTGDQRTATAVMYALGYCVAEARRRHGAEVVNLPEPISVQVVQFDIQRLDFISFQLNTLNFNNNDGVKNFAWVDTQNYLYTKHLPQPWKGEEFKVNRYLDYEPKTFEKLLAVFLYGVPEVAALTNDISESYVDSSAQ